MIVVDTSVWIDFYRGAGLAGDRWLRQAIGRDPIALTDLILGELLRGVPDEATALRTEFELAQFTTFACAGAEAARIAAADYRRLRVFGFTVRSMVDCLTASFCLRHGHQLLHRDRDFDPFERLLGLRVLHPR